MAAVDDFPRSVTLSDSVGNAEAFVSFPKIQGISWVLTDVWALLFCGAMPGVFPFAANVNVLDDGITQIAQLGFIALTASPSSAELDRNGLHIASTPGNALEIVIQSSTTNVSEYIICTAYPN